jgi:hypothetical protein
MAARAALNTILRDAAKTPLLRMTVPLAHRRKIGDGPNTCCHPDH